MAHISMGLLYSLRLPLFFAPPMPNSCAPGVCQTRSAQQERPTMAPEYLRVRPLNFSKTQRLVLLIDLQPLLTLQDPTPYFTVLKSAADRLLSFPPLAASLSAFKLFFSSLSPVRSEAVLGHISVASLSFNLQHQTLDFLSATLNSLSTLADLPKLPCSPLASHVASSLLQLTHDYAWETKKDNLPGEDDIRDDDFVKISSNLVILLSPIGQSVKWFTDYLELCEFSEVFGCVRDAFVARDIHLCWIDLKIDESRFQVSSVNNTEHVDELAILKDGIRKMEWGICSSDLLVFISALLPLALIYPKIGVSCNSINFDGMGERKCKGELSLMITDRNGMPLESKCCDLEFVNLECLPGNVSKGYTKLRIKSIHRGSEIGRIGGFFEIVLIKERFRDSRKNREKVCDDLLLNRVLEMLGGEVGGISCRIEIPNWQIILSFLHMNDCWAMASLLSSKGDTFMAILRPFTIHVAFLYVLDVVHVSIRDDSSSKLVNVEDKPRDTCYEGEDDSNRCLGSQTSTSTSDSCQLNGNSKRKKIQRHQYQYMTWSSFCKAAFEGSKFDLFDLYAARHVEKSKKLKFLKCWMNQFGKVGPCCLTALPGYKCLEELSSCNKLLSDLSSARDATMYVPESEISDSFFNNLSERIKHGLESGIDLQNLSERVIKSSIYWLRHNGETECKTGHQQATEISVDSCSKAFFGELLALLLRSPKEMKKMQQDSDASLSLETIVREYELQVFLRMEILRSDLSTMMVESGKSKLLKDLCALLEIIQYLVAGGIHGHLSLYDYVELTIKSRYLADLEDVVEKIYVKMDLVPFEEEDETPSILFNSEDSNQSWRDKHDIKYEPGCNNIGYIIPTEEETYHPSAFACENEREIEEDDHSLIVNKARERWERVRGSKSFMTKARDLQRVWAPKQPKAMTCKYDSHPNKSKRKDRQAGSSSSVVCETPMTGNKHARHGIHNSVEDTPYSVSKSLFKDT